MDVDVLRLLLAVAGAVGGQAHSPGGRLTRSLNLPALFRESDLNFLPELGVLVFVVGMQVVDVKPTDVTEDLLCTLVAPMVGGVTDGVVMGAWEPPVVAKLIETCFWKFLNAVNVTELSWYRIDQVGHVKNQVVRD